MSIFAKLFKTKHAPNLSGLMNMAIKPCLMLPRFLDAAISVLNTGMMREEGDYSPQGSKPEHLVTMAGTVGIVSIRGMLTQRFSFWTWLFDGTSYDVIQAAVSMLANDPNVTGIVLDIDSPGGETSGCFDASDMIFAARSMKPIHAVVNDSGYSAAYALASAASSITVTRTAGVGSVGVIAAHLDVSTAEANAGLKYTLVIAGEKKADFTEHAPLSDRARTDVQAEVDRLYDIFVATVARNRSMDEDVIRATQAGVYFGPVAVQAGMADQVGNIDTVLALFSIGTPEPMAEEAPQDTQQDTPEDPMQDAPEDPPADVPEEAAASVLDIAMAANLPADLFAAIMKSKPSAQNIEQRIASARSIADICAAAGLREMAADYVEKSAGIETVRAQVIAAAAETTQEIITTLPAQQQHAGKSLAQEIYGRRAAASRGQPLPR